MARAARPWAAKLDMYKKVPVDLLDGSRQGSVVSWFTIVVILLLFFKETSDFFTTRLTTEFQLDRRPRYTSGEKEHMIRVSFNITMMDLKCDFVEVDVISVLGNNQNVTKLVSKYPIDAKGVLNLYAARTGAQSRELALHDTKVSQSLDELHLSGEAAISLDKKTLPFALNENTLLFVDFYAGWCSHCKKLAPTWEVLAKIMNDASNEDVEDAQEDYSELELSEAEKLAMPVLIAKVDCVAHHSLCVSQEIGAYPTLRLFVEGKPWDQGDYRGERTIMDMIQFLKEAELLLGKEGILSMEHINAALGKHLNVSAEEKHWAEALERTRHHHVKNDWNPDSHPGCQIAGSILVHRVPGNFYIQAYSPHHNLAPHMTNVSHEVHELAFAPADRDQTIRHSDVLPPKFLSSARPIDGMAYVTESLHQAHHHYLKLITTNERFFQVIQNSQMAEYRNDQIPEAKFMIDLSPIAVQYERASRPWYDYVTSLMAIVGGTFTVVGLVDSGIHEVARRRRKMQAIGKRS